MGRALRRCRPTRARRCCRRTRACRRRRHRLARARSRRLARGGPARGLRRPCARRCARAEDEARLAQDADAPEDGDPRAVEIVDDVADRLDLVQVGELLVVGGGPGLERVGEAAGRVEVREAIDDRVERLAESDGAGGLHEALEAEEEERVVLGRGPARRRRAGLGAASAAASLASAPRRRRRCTLARARRRDLAGYGRARRGRARR